MVLVPGRPYPEAHVVHEGIPEFVLTAITEQSIPGEHVVPSLLNTYPEEHFVPAIALVQVLQPPQLIIFRAGTLGDVQAVHVVAPP